MIYFKAVQSTAAGLFLGMFGPLILQAIIHASEQKATGMGVFRAGLVSPTFWLMVACFSGLFFLASRAGSRIVGMFLFWVPTTLINLFGIAIVSLFGYAILSRPR